MPSRRTALRAAALLVGGGVLAGCGIRLERSIGPFPAPTRTPMPDEELFTELTRRAERLAGLAARVPDPAAAAIAGRHRDQARVLRSILAAGGAPAPTDAVASASAGPPPPSAEPQPSSSPPAPSATPTTPAPGAPTTVAELGAAEAALPAAGDAATTGRDLVVAILAHDAATATRLGATPTWPAGAPLSAEAAAAGLAPTRAARYAVQVAAAHRPVSARAADLELDRTLAARERGLLRAAGAAAPPPALGHTLPFPVESGADADRLVTAALDALVAHGLEPAMLGDAGSPGLLAVARLLAEAVVLAAGAGLAQTPFPGRSTP